MEWIREEHPEWPRHEPGPGPCVLHRLYDADLDLRCEILCTKHIGYGHKSFVAWGWRISVARHDFQILNGLATSEFHAKDFVAGQLAILAAAGYRKS